MLIGRIIGDVVATQKAPSHEGRKILVVQPLNLDGTDRGDPVLALDAVDAVAFEAQARAGGQALASGDPIAAASLLRASGFHYVGDLLGGYDAWQESGAA